MKFVLCFLFVGIFTAYFLSNASELRILIFWMLVVALFVYFFIPTPVISQLFILSSLKFYSWGCSCRKTTKFGQINCLTNNFLHCKFHLFMFSSSKVYLGGHFRWFLPQRTPKFGQNNCLTNNFIHC